MFNPENAYYPLTENQRLPTSGVIIPSGESGFEGFSYDKNADQLPHLVSGINSVYTNILTSGNVNLIHKDKTITFGNDEVFGTVNSDFSPFFLYSELSSALENKVSIPINSLSNINPYIHYYPISQRQSTSSYSQQEIQSSFNIEYNGSDFKRTIFRPYKQKD